jgi:protein tyrosine phosphatase (PTP) superfamily phosphohydrolase (DUF442 family)
MRSFIRSSTLAAFLLLAGACSKSAPPEAQEAAPAATRAAPAAVPSPVLQSASALGIANAHEPLPGLLTAGQIDQAQFDGLAQAGFTTFVSLRLPDEEGAGWEEAYAKERGLSFTRLPIAGADGLTRANVEALDHILRATGASHTVLYCGSANRVGALLALRAGWLGGSTAQDALALGRAAGLTRLEADVARLLETP